MVDIDAELTTLITSGTVGMIPPATATATPPTMRGRVMKLTEVTNARIFIMITRHAVMIPTTTASATALPSLGCVRKYECVEEEL